MKINIRLATDRDIQKICEIVSQLTPGLPHDYRDAIVQFNKHIEINPDYFLWVAELDEKVVGTAMMHLQHKLSYHCGRAAHLEDVVVDKDHRGKGIGELLVNKAIETAKQYECYKILLTCFQKTTAYYEKFGFVQHDIGMRLTLVENLYPSSQS